MSADMFVKCVEVNRTLLMLKWLKALCSCPICPLDKTALVPAQKIKIQMLIQFHFSQLM
jgi:hypothetical protein